MINPENPNYTNTPVSPLRPRYSYAPRGQGDTPAVSIITPFYNTGSVFLETVDSVLRQSLQQWEWLIIDDGSSDSAALGMLNHVASSDQRIKVIRHEKNLGLPSARNTGFQHARAPYVLQLDSDDLIEPTVAEKWLWFLHANPAFAFVKGFIVSFEGQEYLTTRGFHEGAAFLQDNLVSCTAMIRKDVHEQVGGYTIDLVGGLEDWDFWLKCADSGYWGGTVPEYGDWYRRRANHADRWTHFSDTGIAQRRKELAARYPGLYERGAPPAPVRTQTRTNEDLALEVPCSNRLAKRGRRMLYLLPWLNLGGADKFNLDLCKQLTQRGWEISIATTVPHWDPWAHEFAAVTPDIFFLDHLVPLQQYPAFLRYLIESRDIDVVLISNSKAAYQFLPYLRAMCPCVAFVDYNHMEEEQWERGGHSRTSTVFNPLLDIAVVSSQHLKRWHVKNGVDEKRVEVCYTSIDGEQWKPCDATRARVRDELGIPADAALILYAARVCAQKKPQVLVEVVKQLSQNRQDFAVVVAGDGPDLDFVRSQFAQAGLIENRRVLILGAVPNARVGDLMRAADIFFLPSEWEGIALSVFEAMAAGAVVLGTNVGGQAELVVEGTGFLAEKHTDAAETQAYITVLANWLDNRHTLEAIRAAARERIVRHFALSDMGDRMHRLLLQACERHRADVSSPSLDAAAAVISARRAIEFLRLTDVADQIWGRKVELERQVSADRAHFTSEVARLQEEVAYLRAELVQIASATDGPIPQELVPYTRGAANLIREIGKRESLRRILLNPTWRNLGRRLLGTLRSKQHT